MTHVECKGGASDVSIRLHRGHALVACVLAEADAVQVATVEQGAAHGAVLNGNSTAAAPGARAMPPSREPAPPLAALCMIDAACFGESLAADTSTAPGCWLSAVCSHRCARGAWAATLPCGRTPRRTGKPGSLRLSILCF